MTAVPAIRVRAVNDAPVHDSRSFVLYWMIASRRTRYNFGLQHAVNLAAERRLPLVVLEALECDYPWASDRLHRFVLDGMKDNAAALASTPVRYYPYVEPASGAGRGLLEALARHAAAVVTDDYPCFFLPRLVQAAGERLTVRLEQVDSNGLVPLQEPGIAFPSAYSFRRFVQRHARAHLEALPVADPLDGVVLPRLKQLPEPVLKRWPPADPALLDGDGAALAALPIDHSVPAAPISGGSAAARSAWKAFLGSRLKHYPADRNEPEQPGTSGLSPYLHFGHISTHEILADLLKAERWTPRRLGERATGERSGFWGVSEGAEAFLDQLITWRELGFNMCARRPDYDRYESLPEWARATLEGHAGDPRPHTYALSTLEQARTHDRLWNAAQGQLVRDGWFHNYMRMLWGKKILEWSTHPRDALNVMVELMNKYSLDGRDPNSYSGYFWTLGRYDRPWPERPIFGKIRCMTSDSTARKLSVKKYVAEYAAEAGTLFDR
jgi:deoxyribodipyrimidine photo-lyase